MDLKPDESLIVNNKNFGERVDSILNCLFLPVELFKLLQECEVYTLEEFIAYVRTSPSVFINITRCSASEILKSHLLQLILSQEKKSFFSKIARERYENEHCQSVLEQEENNKMQLSEWLDNKDDQPNIFVDQDNTLLYLTSKDTISQLSDWAKENTVYEKISGYQTAILPRPHALHFLSECKKLGNVYVLTAGISHFQKQVLEKVYMLDAVADVYGRDNFHEVPQSKKKVLVDNLPFNHPNSKAKLHAMGGGVYLQVPDWEGQNPKDNALLRALTSLKKYFTAA